jgi:hypothetical protein
MGIQRNVGKVFVLIHVGWEPRPLAGVNYLAHCALTPSTVCMYGIQVIHFHLTLY